MENISLIACLLVALVGCGADVWDGSPVTHDINPDDYGRGGSDAGGSGGGSATGGAGGAGGSIGGTGGSDAAVAMSRRLNAELYEQWRKEQEQMTGTTVTTGGGNDLDPNDLFLIMSSEGAACDEFTPMIECGGQWRMTIVVPPALQYVGVHDLSDPALTRYSTRSEYGPRNGNAPDDCSYFGGSPGPGTLEIVEIGDNRVRFILNTEPFNFSGDPSGEYDASRCD